MKNPAVYIVFSSTPSRIGKLIRSFTGEDFNHVSIALNPELTQMYGFARRYYRTPFYGGFVRESRSRYCHNGITANIRICKLPITPVQYETLANFLEGMHQNQESYPYNHLSAAAALFRRPVKIQDSYTCIEFCVQVLYSLGIQLDPDRYYTVGQVEQLLRPYSVYTGPMLPPTEYDHAYYARRPISHPTTATVTEFIRLLKRLKA